MNLGFRFSHDGFHGLQKYAIARFSKLRLCLDLRSVWPKRYGENTRVFAKPCASG
jgi:hypothetical protein